MRIAFLSFEAFRHGGISTYTRELLNGVAAAGHNVVLFAPPPPPGIATGLSPEVALRTVAVAALPLTMAPTFWLRLPLVFRAAEREDGRFDIVHSNTYSDALLPRFASKGIRVTTVHHLGTSTAEAMGLSFFDMLFHPSNESGPALALEGLCLRRADHLIAVSEFTRGDILKRYPDIHPRRISVVYQGARTRLSTQDPETLERLKKTWGIEENDRTLLYVGRLEERKGISLLMKAFALLDPHTHPRLLLVGSGSAPAYKRLAENLGIGGRVVFAGYVDDSTLTTAYSLATALVHPASIEGFGLTIADAVASRLPVVAFRVGSIPELVRDLTDGYLVEYGDIMAFSEAMAAVVQSNPNVHRSALIKEPMTFAWEHTVEETLSLWERLLGNDGKG